MLIFKKLIFALPFFLFSLMFISQASAFLQNPSLILSLDTDVLIRLVVLCLLLLFSGLFFVVFATFSSESSFVMPVALVTSLPMIIFLPNQTGFLIVGGTVFSLVIINFYLKRKLATYLSFQPSSLLAPAVKQTVTLLILVLSLAFYFQASAEIKAHGFKVPPSMIDLVIKLSPQNLGSGTNTGMPQITSEQLLLFEQNPTLLKQYGLDPKILNEIKNINGQKNISANDLLRPMVESQFQTILANFSNILPAFLSLVFFLTLVSLFSLLSIFLPLFLWLIFYLLEKNGFTRYEVETREVKKLVI